MFKEERGFTLVELLIVILIVAILAALALPQFSKTKERAIGKEAIANLKLIAAAERIYLMEASAYYPIPADSQSSITNINNYLRLSMPSGATRNWDYTVSSLTNVSTATRTSPGTSCTYTMGFTTEEPTPGSGCP